MIDLHTHILPLMDDGASSVEQALTMLQMQAEQGVTTVALTPHFYRMREHTEDFLHRRTAAVHTLNAALADVPHVDLIVGAEVAWVPGMADWPELEELCYENTRILLVELPIAPWNDEMFRQLYTLESRRGVIPMIAHFERYYACQSKANMTHLLEMGFPIQISAQELLHFSGRKNAINLLQTHQAVLISDCHNDKTRPPNIGAAMNVLEKKLGSHAAAQIANNSHEVLYG